MLKVLPRSPYFWAIFGVGIEIFAYPNWSYHLLAFPVLAFYLAAIERIDTTKQALYVGLSVTVIGTFGAFTWITYVLTEMGQMPLALALLLHLLFSLLCLPNFYCFFVFGQLTKTKAFLLPKSLHPIYWTIAWIALEFLWRFAKIFPEMIGNTQWHWLELLQHASWGGVSAVSFFVVFWGCSLYFFFKDFKAKAYQINFALACLLILLGHLWGKQRIETIESLPHHNIRIASIQANIGNADKAIADNGVAQGLEKIVRTYSRLTDNAALQYKPEMIIWPETGYPMSYPLRETNQASRLSRRQARLIEDHSKQHNYTLIAGSYETVAGKNFNAVVKVGPGQVRDSYRKTHLMIFGEYMPFSETFPFLKKLNPNLGDFGQGTGPYPMSWIAPNGQEWKLGVNICYEELIMSFMRNIANNGAQLFLNVSNDSWFGPGQEPYQHLELSVPRTVENGIPLVRATNTGLTTYISETGRLLDMGGLFTEEIRYFEMPVLKDPIPTLYKRWGEWFGWLMTTLWLISTAFVLNKRTNE